MGTGIHGAGTDCLKTNLTRDEHYASRYGVVVAVWKCLEEVGTGGVSQGCHEW